MVLGLEAMLMVTRMLARFGFMLNLYDYNFIDSKAVVLGFELCKHGYMLE